MPKYPLDINPTSDTFIQYLFALKEHEPFLLSFVNAVLADANRPLAVELTELTQRKLSQFPQNSAELRSWLDFFFYANCRTEDEMEVLLDPATLARNAYDEYCDFCQTPEMRDLALMEEKAARDYRSIISEKVAEAQARGELKGKRQLLLQFLNRRFTASEVNEVEPVIQKITSLDELDRLFELAMDAVLFEDFKNGL